ncbi:MAG: carboxymuconolactone decarboxylase family protein, partial [Polynucleobacter victoriensis]
MNTKEGFAKGLAIRKEVLGEEYVNNSLANADEFSMPLQEYVTEHAWGAVWGRPGLTKKHRSMITLSILVAINRPHELKIHLRGALNNGVTKEEIRELFLHAAAY